MQGLEPNSELGVTDQTNDEQASDERIVLLVSKGDREQFRHLVARYKDMVYAMIYRQVGNRSVAEELAQESFVKAYRNIRQFRFESKFSTWLTRIALNHTNSYFSSKRYKQKMKTESFNTTAHDTSTESPEHIMEKKELISQFHRALSTLKPKFREVVSLCGLEGKSYEEAAETLKIPVGTVRSRLNKARLVLKEAFIQQSLEEVANEQ